MQLYTDTYETTEVFLSDLSVILNSTILLEMLMQTFLFKAFYGFEECHQDPWVAYAGFLLR